MSSTNKKETRLALFQDHFGLMYDAAERFSKKCPGVERQVLPSDAYVAAVLLPRRDIYHRGTLAGRGVTAPANLIPRSSVAHRGGWGGAFNPRTCQTWCGGQEERKDLGWLDGS